MNIKASVIILLVVVVAMIEANPIDDGDAAVDIRKEHQVVSLMELGKDAGMQLIYF